MSTPIRADRRARMRRLMLVRLAFLTPLLVAVFVLHVSGTALVITRILRIAVVGGLVLMSGWFRTRRPRSPEHPEP